MEMISSDQYIKIYKEEIALKKWYVEEYEWEIL
jgi:hypothetical protein